MTDSLRLFQTEEEYNAVRDSLEYPTVSYVEGGRIHYTLQPLATPLYIEALADGMTVMWNVGSLEYSTDLRTWNVLPEDTESPTINTSERIYLRGNFGVDKFVISQPCNVGGNIMSLLFLDNFEDIDLTNVYVDFQRLFAGQPVVNASKLLLPVTTLTSYCYSEMFEGCTSLEVAPALPATTLAESCYKRMFYGCTSLMDVPELPATTLAESCYESMFEGCTSIGISLYALPATTLDMFCYYRMFYGCTALMEAPELPATTLEYACYESMFEGCSTLYYIKMLAIDIYAFNCLNNWVNGVDSWGTFVKNASLSEGTIGRGVSGIPEGWEVRDDYSYI